MGYVVNTIDSCFVLERENYEEAFKAVCELNAHDELKTGGRYPATEAKPEGSKSLGNPNVWFPWMPWDYDVTCSGIVEVFETLGFDVVEDARGISCLPTSRRVRRLRSRARTGLSSDTRSTARA